MWFAFYAVNLFWEMNSVLCCLHWVPDKLFSCWVLALVVHNVPLTGNGLSAIWIKVKIEIHLACIKGRRKRGCSKFCFLPSSSSGNNDVALIEKDIIDKFSFREVTWCQESPVKAFFNLQKLKAIFSSNVSCSFREQNFTSLRDFLLLHLGYFSIPKSSYS